MMRSIILSEKEADTYEMPFDSEKVKDSEALHMLLCFVDPGTEYTVRFINLPSDWTPTDTSIRYL